MFWAPRPWPAPLSRPARPAGLCFLGASPPLSFLSSFLSSLHSAYSPFFSCPPCPVRGACLGLFIPSLAWLTASGGPGGPLGLWASAPACPLAPSLPRARRRMTESSSAQKPLPRDPLTLRSPSHTLPNHPRPRWPVLPFSFGASPLGKDLDRRGGWGERARLTGSCPLCVCGEVGRGLGLS